MSREVGLTKEEKLKLIDHFLLSSPPGEFDDVLADTKILIDDDKLINKQAVSTFRKFNVEELIPIDVKEPTPHKLILCTYGQIDDDIFYDPIGNKMVTIDQASCTVVSVSNAPAEQDNVKKRRVMVQEAIDHYVKDRYLEGFCCVFPNRENSNEFIITISCSKFNPRSFWGGRWKSIYRVCFESNKKVKINGKMSIHVHYYEDGNVQLKTSRDYEDKIDAKDMEKLSKALGKALSDCEGKFQDQIDGTCKNLSEIFKLLRRRLPFTQQKFDFITAHHEMISQYSTSGKNKKKKKK